MRMVAEGVGNAKVVCDIAREHGVEMPITEAIYKVVQGEVSAADAVHALMTRARKGENETLVKDLL